MPESSAPVAASGRSGESVRQVGPYRSVARIPLIVFFRAGDRFPEDAEGKSTTWALVRDEDLRTDQP